ncbi:MAG TPA: Fur family transcriptional regulator [Candidatus Nanoarchaeia archaeon]|nr:Fur family transcriptional regulator [Candidatus Nanoarchaeia archaeon]
MLERLEQYLHSKDYKLTNPRREVFLHMQKHDPCTVQDATLQIKADRASVYRALKLFRQLGIVHDVVIGGRRMIELTDEFDSHHHHLTCLQCGRTETLNDPAIEQRLVSLAQGRGYQNTSHQIEISGICASCSIG